MIDFEGDPPIPEGNYKLTLAEGCRCFCCYGVEGEPVPHVPRRKKTRKSVRRETSEGEFKMATDPSGGFK